jgi:hypothetical protein
MSRDRPIQVEPIQAEAIQVEPTLPVDRQASG